MHIVAVALGYMNVCYDSAVNNFKTLVLQLLLATNDTGTTSQPIMTPMVKTDQDPLLPTAISFTANCVPAIALSKRLLIPPDNLVET